MSVNQMNTGTDYSVSFYDGNTGALVDLGDVQDVRISAMKHDIKSTPFNAPPRFGYVPDGYGFDITVVRTAGALEQFFLQTSANFDLGTPFAPGALNLSVKNPDGSISRYQFTSVVMFMPNISELARDKVVTHHIVGLASTWTRIA